MKTIDRQRLAALMAAEEHRFIEANPRSHALHERAKASLLDGVPMNWMVKWASPFPVFVEWAEGARFADVDGHEYVDFCLGDTGAMAGHSPAPTVAAVQRQIARGITTMLPSEDAVWVGEELTPPFRPAAVAVHAHGDRRQPLRTPPGAGDHGPPQGRRS